MGRKSSFKEVWKGDSQNKGVAVTSDSFANSEEITQCTEPINDIRSDLQRTIDQMGPITPNFTNNTSSDADNEESVYSTSSTSALTSYIQEKHKGNSCPRNTQTDSNYVTRDTSESTVVLNCGTRHGTSVYVDKQNEVQQCGNGLCLQSGPAFMPPPFCFNPNCDCAYSMGHLQRNVCGLDDGKCQPTKKTSKESDFRSALAALVEKFRKTSKDSTVNKESLELYKINVLEPRDDHSPPRRFVFDLVDEIPKPDTNTVATNTKIPCNIKTCNSKKGNRKNQGIYTTEPLADYSTSSLIVTQNTVDGRGTEQRQTFYQKNGKQEQRIDVYYFDHGNAGYYRTTDSPPLILTELLAERTEAYATKFWANFFGTIYIGFAFFTSFILQFFRFILYSLLRPLTIGVLQLASDYFFKPFLAVLFNAVIQPPLIFLYNIATSLRDLCDPIAEGFGYFLREIAFVFRAIRLADVKVEKCCCNTADALSKKKIKCECIPTRPSQKCGCSAD